MIKLERKDVLRRIAGLPLSKKQAVVCALTRHSRIVTSCWGYVYCGRCAAQIADKLAGAGYSQAEQCVEVGHNCATCHANFKKLSWEDKLLTPDPFINKNAEKE